MVDYYSSLAEVMTENLVDPATLTSDTAQWNFLTVYNTNLTDIDDSGVSAIDPDCAVTACATDASASDDVTYFRIGLFGTDLADFKTDCALSQNCNVGDYYQFDGWSIGMLSHTYSAAS